MAVFKLVGDDGTEFPLRGGGNLVGRFSHCDVVLRDELVAGEHARVDVSGDRVTVTDLGSPFGTWVDDARLEGERELAPGMALRIGPARLRLVRAAGPSVWFRRLARARGAYGIALRLALAALAAFLLTIGGLRLVCNPESVRRDVRGALESVFRRDVEIGAITLSPLGSYAELRDVAVHNLPEFGGEPLIKVDAVRVRLRSGRYFGVLGTVDADVVLEGLAVLLERTARGRWNVGDLALSVARAVWGAGAALSVRDPLGDVGLRLSAPDATLRLRDDVTGRNEEIPGIRFECALAGRDRPVTYRLSMDMLPGTVEARGEFRLFENGRLTGRSVRGRLLELRAEGLDLGASAVFLPSPLERIVSARPAGSSLDAELAISAETLAELSMRSSGRLRGPLVRSEPLDVTFRTELTFDALAARIDRAELAVSAPAWELECQGRLVPSGPPFREGAELLDMDVTFRSQARHIPYLLGLATGPAPGGDDWPLDGKVTFHVSTTGPTRALEVRTELRAEALACRLAAAAPENVAASFRGTVSLVGWSRVESVAVHAATAEASFLHAALGPGTISGLLEPSAASAGLGPLEFELDLGELARRYGPLLPAGLPRSRLHGWADVSGSSGRLACRSAAEASDGTRAEGTAVLVLAARDVPRLQIDATVLAARGGAAGAPEDGLRAELRGELALAWPEPGFDIALSGAGSLSKLLELVRARLVRAGSVWARGRFELAEARFVGTARRFTTNGKLELLEPELWGGSPTVPPFSESRLDAIWNLDVDLTGAAPAIRANLLRGSSSALRWRLEGEVEDLFLGLGRYDLHLHADLDRIGAALRKLNLLPASADFRGSLAVELAADTRRGNVRLDSLKVDTPFLEAEGRGEIAGLPFPALGFGRPGPGPQAAAPAVGGAAGASGKLSLRAKLDVDEAARLAGAFLENRAEARGPAPAREWTLFEAKGELGLELTAEGTGNQVAVEGLLDLNRFVGRLGRYLRKPADELASLRFSLLVSPERPDLLVLRSGTLTLGELRNPAALELSGRFSQERGGFELALRSDRFPVAPLAALVPELVSACSGEAALDLRASGERGALLGLEGELKLLGAELSMKDLPGLRARLAGSLAFGGGRLSSRDLSAEFVLVGDGGGTARESRAESEPPLLFGPGAPGEPPRAERLVASTRLDELDIGLRDGVLEGRFRLSAGPVDLDLVADTWPPYLETFLAEGTSPGARLSGELRASALRAFGGRLEARDFSSKMVLGRSGIELADVGFSLWGGRVTGGAKAEFAAGGPALTGQLSAEGLRLEELAEATGIRGALKGELSGRLSWDGAGLSRSAFERTWALDAEARTGRLLVDPRPFPLAREVAAALERVLGASAPAGAAESKPVSVRVGLRRGRLSVEALEFEFADGLKLAVRGRSELDGRIAGWVSVEGLPVARASGDRTAWALLEELVRRGALRFAVTGTWVEPSVDVRGLLWMLPRIVSPERTEPPDRPAR